jgi:hypothetical protein
MSVEQVANATAEDESLLAVMKSVKSRRWSKDSPFFKFRDELTIYDDRIVLRGERIILPTALQDEAVQLAHRGHQALSKTKALMRFKVWFPGMDTGIERAIKECIPCQANSRATQSAPLKISELPSHPWLDISIDFLSAGLPTGEYLLVLVDEYSRYPFAEVVKSTAMKDILTVRKKIFSIFGFPETIKSDNGPPLSKATTGPSS